MVWEAVAGGLASGAGSAIAGGLFGGDDDGPGLGAFQPYYIRKSPLGKFSSYYKPGTKQLRMRFDTDPALREVQKLYQKEAARPLYKATRKLDKQMAALQAREIKDLRRSTREGLYSMGGLGTHAGRQVAGEVERALAEARISRNLQARTQAFNERQGAFQNYLTAITEPTRLLGALATNRNPAAAQIANAQFMDQAANRAQELSFGTSLAQGLTPALGRGLSAFGDYVGNIFNPAPSYGSSFYGQASDGNLYSPF